MRSRRSLLCLFLTTTLWAHDLYVLPDSFSTKPHASLQVGFHNGDSFPTSEVSPLIDRFQRPELRAQSAVSPIRVIHVVGDKALGDVDVPGSGNLVLSVQTTPNLLELPAQEFTAYLKEEGLTHVIEWRVAHQEESKPSRERYSKYAKSLLIAGNPNDFAQQPIGQTFEIVPLANPYRMRQTDKLLVLVLFRGKPAADVQLEASWADGAKSKTSIVGRTDKKGHVEVELSNNGLWRLHSVLMERCSDKSAADWESYWASLTFRIGSPQ
jgi:uncharacterized GH25 family protein